MDDAGITDLLKPYSDLRVLIPMVAVFVIIYAIVRRSIKDTELFQEGTGIVVAMCVSLLAMYGVDRTLVRIIIVL